MPLASPRGPRLRRAGAGLAAAAVVVCLMLTGCQPEPLASPTGSASASPSPTTASPTPTPTPTAEAGEVIALPAACEELSSPAMLAALQERGPLNDPDVTMTSTQNVAALEILSSGVPTIRCTWGAPSETGLATNVTIIDAEQSETITQALIGEGFACEDTDGGTVCRYEQTMVTLDDDLVKLTETHVLRGNAWVSTATINFEVPGYTEDIIDMLWG
jgi:hypothetical protein